MRLVGAVTAVTQSGNVLFALQPTHRALQIESGSNLTSSNGNDYFNPWENLVVQAGGATYTLAQWQASSGQDGASSTHWYTLGPADPPRSEIFVNDSGVTLNVGVGQGIYENLDQQPVNGTLGLGPYSSRILVRGLDVLFVDGFESGNTSAWSSSVP